VKGRIDRSTALKRTQNHLPLLQIAGRGGTSCSVAVSRLRTCPLQRHTLRSPRPPIKFSSAQYSVIHDRERCGTAFLFRISIRRGLMMRRLWWDGRLFFDKGMAADYWPRVTRFSCAFDARCVWLCERVTASHSHHKRRVTLGHPITDDDRERSETIDRSLNHFRFHIFFSKTKLIRYCRKRIRRRYSGNFENDSSRSENTSITIGIHENGIKKR
jgi:hypothetical protein